MIKNLVLFALFSFCSFCGTFFADEIVMTDDTKITGEITMFNTSIFEIVNKEGKATRKDRKKLKSYKFDSKLDEEFFQKLEEADMDVEKIFETALWAFENKRDSKYKVALLRCLDIDGKYERAGELLGYKKNADGIWERPKILNSPKPPLPADLKKLKKKAESQPTKEDPEEELSNDADPERQLKLLQKKASTAWKKIDTKFKAKQYEAIREALETIAKDFPETEEGKKAQHTLDHWQELLEDRELDPIRQLIKIDSFTIDQVQFRTAKVPWPELRLEFSISKDIDELGFRFTACKKAGDKITLCRSYPQIQVFIDVEKKKGHKIVSTIFTVDIPKFGNEFTWGRYEMLYKGKILFSGVTQGSVGEWWIDKEGKEIPNDIWLGYHKSSEANVHTHPWQTNTLWTQEELPKRPGYKPSKK